MYWAYLRDPPGSVEAGGQGQRPEAFAWNEQKYETNKMYAK